MKRAITRADIMPMADYGKVRAERRRAIAAKKQNRRVAVGPFATFFFETYDTMLHQVHEMLFVEKGGEEQIAGELEAYNPLVPNGRELVATVMLEIDDPARRARELARLGGVEETISLQFDGETVKGTPTEDEQARTDPETGKTSSVHFIHFRFTPAQIAKFRTPGAKVIVAIEHPNYAHMSQIPDAVRAELAGDFD
jgi:hypothetical protein